MSMSNKVSCVAIAGLVSLAGVAQAQVNWVPTSGSGTFFTYTGGFSDNGRFGNPTLVGDSFQFTPTTFVANSVNGNAASVPDRMQVDLQCRMLASQLRKDRQQRAREEMAVYSNRQATVLTQPSTSPWRSQSWVKSWSSTISSRP